MENSIVFHSIGCSEIVPLDDIVFCKADGSYTKVFMIGGKTITVSKNLCTIERMICNELFVRIHKSFTINLKYLRKIYHAEDKIGMANEIKIPFSRSKKKMILEKINS